MADGSSLIVRGPVLVTHGSSGPRLSEVGAGQVLVGCCNACGAVGEVDRRFWSLPYELAMSVAVAAHQLRCLACGRRSVSLQIWPIAPHPTPRPSAFQRWR